MLKASKCASLPIIPGSLLYLWGSLYAPQIQV